MRSADDVKDCRKHFGGKDIKVLCSSCAKCLLLLTTIPLKTTATGRNTRGDDVLVAGVS